MTYLLGVAAITHPVAAAAGSVIVAGLLAARSRIHRFATEILSASELRDALTLAAAALVLLPVVPDASIRWLGGLNPARVWTLAVVIMALQGAGYAAQRWLGARRGLALAGLAAGFVSSTATIAAMGARARKNPALTEAGAASGLFSTMATFLQFAVVVAAAYPRMLATFALPLAVGLLAASIAAAGFFHRARRERPGEERRGRAFSLAHATFFAAGLAAVTAAVGLVNDNAGADAARLGAAIAGFADAHAAGAAILSLAADGKLEAGEALRACLLGISTNAASKVIVAFAAGGRAFGWRIAAGIATSLAAMWATAYALASV